MVAYNKGDLEFILAQIKISEQHASREDANGVPIAGTPLDQLIHNPLLPWGLRTVDGTFNNIIPGRENFGAADELFPRLLEPEYGTVTADSPFIPGPDATTTDYGVAGNVVDPQIRLASNAVVDQSLNNPAAILAALKFNGIEGQDAQDALAAIEAAHEASLNPGTPNPATVAAAQAAFDAASAQQALAATVAAAAATTGTAYAAAAGEAASAAAAFSAALAAIDALGTSVGVAGTSIDAPLRGAIDAARDLAVTARNEANQLLNALDPAGPDLVSVADFNAATALQQAANQLVTAMNQLFNNNQLGTITDAADVGRYIVAQSNATTANDLAAPLPAQITASSNGAAATAVAADAALAEADAALAAAQADLADAQAGISGPTLQELLDQFGLVMTESGSLEILNVAPDEGISAPFNSWMTLFGQFFDHGLDLVTKGNAGTVFIPLQPDDPLYDPASPSTNFMALTRATQFVDENGVVQHRNTTTPFVDQNQTYTSHASHQVFLREYVTIADGADANSNPDILATGRLLEGVDGGLATWADVKAQAANVLGLRLHDGNIGNVPLLATDEYGRFLRGENGFAQVVVAVTETDGTITQTRNVLVEGVATDADDGLAGLDLRSIAASDLPAGFAATPGFSIAGISVVGTEHAFLDDIAHTANPFFSDGQLRGEDSNATVGHNLDQLGDDGQQMSNQQGPARGGSAFYDDELLDQHFITGDGRGNENIGLTAVHHVFHSEHNRLMEHTKDVVIASRDLDFIREWVLPEFQSLVPTAQGQLNSAGEEAALLASLNAAEAWDGERLFQAARFGTEMQYQHMVFEEFARKVNPLVDLFIFNPTMDIDPAIFAEFAHVVYRFGHSMLNETVDRLDPSAQISDDELLFDAFLNPVEFDLDGTMTSDEAAGAIVRGMTRQHGNAIDEHVTDALRNNLVGLPLDLATLNMARARDTGVPSLNHAREQFFEMTKSEWLKPYVSWTDFAQALKNPASIVNFIAAYGTHDSITSVATLDEKRAAAEALVFGGTGSPADRLDFLNGRGVYDKAAGLGGLDDVDFWLGGLAEEILPFGGMLGSTFTFVFEAQMQNLQNGDRFYYLSRTQGLHFLTELENNSFASIVKKNTDLGATIANDQIVPDGTNGSSHLPGELFARNDFILEVNQNFQQDYNGDVAGRDPIGEDPVLEALQPKVLRVNDNGGGAANNINPGNYPDAIGVIDTDALVRTGKISQAQADVVEAFLNGVGAASGGNADNNTYQNLLHFQGGEHVVLGGTDERDVLIGDLGDDTLWGDGGSDLLIGNHGINRLHGGDGDDIIYGGGDAEFIHGEAGNDIIHAGNGLGDLVFAGSGHDFVIAGEDSTEVFAGEGADFILGTADVDFLLGGEGDDWIEGGEGFDTIAGENSELFFNSSIIGHDVMFAGTNENDFDSESGDDVMVQGESVMRNEGMFGFDWVSFEEHKSFGADADMRIKIFTTVEADILRNRFDQVEAMSGSGLGDILVGDDRIAPGAFDPVEVEAGAGAAETTLIDSELTRGGVNRIAGFQELLGLANNQVNGDQNLVAFDGGNVLIGGDGNDVIQGGGGNDVIDGDKWLNVRIGIYDGNVEIGSAEKMQGAVHFYTADEAAALEVRNPAGNYGTIESEVNNATVAATMRALDGQPLDNLVFQRVVSSSDLHIIREILNDTTDNDVTSATYDGDVDTAVFQGSFAEYTITDANGNVVSSPDNPADPSTFLGLRGRITVEHTLAALNGGGIFDDGTDILENIERLQFADVTLDMFAGLNAAATGAPSIRTLVDPDGTPIVQAGLPLLIALNADGSLAGVTDPDNVSTGGLITGFTVSWQMEATPGAGDFADTGFTGLSFIPPVDLVAGFDGEAIRAVISYTGENGVREVVVTTPTGPIDPATNLVDTPADDLIVGTHAVPNNAANQAFVAAALAAGLTQAQLDAAFTLGQAGSDGVQPNQPLDGGAGADEIRGLGGDDFLEGDAGDDTIDGGAGSDTVRYTANAANFEFSLNPDGTLDVTDLGANRAAAVPESDTLIDVENLIFTQPNPDIILQSADIIAALNELALDPNTDPGALNIVVTGLDDALADIAGTGVLAGGGGDDLLFGLDGDDELDGGAGSDILFGGAGNDTAVFGGSIANFTLALNAEGDLEVLDAAAGTEDALIGIETIRFTGPNPDVEIDVAGALATLQRLALNPNTDPGEISVAATGGADILAGTAGADTIDALGGADIIFGLGGNDIIDAGGGADEIFWSVGDGTDIVDGSAGVDVFDVTGSGGETFEIVAVASGGGVDNSANRTAVQAEFGAVLAGGLLQVSTEIVVIRDDGLGNPGSRTLVAELDNIEELVINGDGAPVEDPNNPGQGLTGGGVSAIGDFTPTSLALATITINGTSGNDTVDITGLDSAHRIVFRTGGGDDVIVGSLRPQDVVELAPGLTPAQFGTPVYNGNGTWTISQNGGGHSVTYTGGPGMTAPSFAAGTTPPNGNGGDGGGITDGSDLAFTANDAAELLKLVRGIPSANSDEAGSAGIRDLEGTGNNIANPDWGSADQSFIRLTQARYGAYDEDSDNLSINPIFDGLDPRNISNVLGAQEDGAKNAAGGNIFLMAFGQYFDHGLDFLPKGGNGTLAIGTQDQGPDDPADLTRGSLNNLGAVQNGATPEHTNKTSPFVDQNQAYGSTELVGQFLREGDGSGGLGARLLSGGPDPSNPEFNLLPSLRETILHHWENNTVFTSEKLIPQGYADGQVSFRDYFTADGIPLVDENGVINELMAHALNSNFMGSGHTLIGDANNFINVLDHYLAGDLRANENYTLTSMHTIWARNHNYHVEKLSQAGFAGTAEELFQAAKIVNEAEYQKVVFDEFADYLIGGIRGSGHHGHDDYNPNADARISHEFAAAVYRVGHSLIGQNITVLDENGTPHSVPLFDAFLNPTNDVGAFQIDTGPGGILTGQAAIDALAQYGYSPQEGFEQLGVNAIIGGIVQQQAEEVDFNLVDAVRNDLVRIRADLFAFNVARGWDVGLGTLNQVRADLLASSDPYVREAVELSGVDLSPYVSWEDFQQRNGLSDEVIAQFQAAYPDLHLDSAEKRDAFVAANPDYALGPDNIVKGIDRVDLWVGGLAETHINDGMVGATFWVVLHEQFDRLQEGDRFYYTDRVDGFDFYAISEEQSFADIVRRNTGLEGLDDDIFAATALDGEDAGSGGADDGDSQNDVGGNQDDDGQPGGDDDNAGIGAGTGSGTGGSTTGNGTGSGTGANGETVVPLVAQGGEGEDVLFGTPLDDMLDGAGGDDVIVALAGSDTAAGGAGADVVDAGGGDDLVFGNSGDDALNAGVGDDAVFGGGGRDRITGGDGADVLDGGTDRDVIDGGAGNDLFIASVGDGDDVYHGGTGLDALDYEAMTANISVDLGQGGFVQSDQSGYDTIDGIENFKGGAGHDTIIASSLVNVMSGGAGNDTFVFESAANANGDEIVGFTAGDKIDISGIYEGGFTLTTGTLNSAGQIQFRVDGADTFLEGLADNDTNIDFSIKIVGRTDLNENDLV